ncbi:MAG TPA: amino acid adenylation domain-containing protein, partial [Pyrinomonadaceae bacterium]
MSDNLAKRLEGLSPEKLALLSKRLQEKGKSPVKRQDISRRRNANSHPLSLAQQRLWFLNQLQPNSAFYNMAGAMRLTGDLNVEALTETLNEIARRHEVLRTCFPVANGKPIQVVSPARAVSIPTTDLRDLPPADQERTADQLVKYESEQPFDLEHGPLYRTRLARLAEDEHLLIITMHHIVGDGWSIGIFLREMAALYEAFSQNRLSPLPELDIQYADYARWQEEWLTGEVLDDQLSYWQRQLSGSNATIDLPFDYERPTTSTHRAATQSFKLSPGILNRLEELSREQNVTLFTTLLAAFYLLLYRYSGQEDINLGSPVVGRSLVQTEELIGFFVNSLVLRGDLSGNPSFTEFLQKVRETVLDAQSNQDVPFEKIVEALQPERSLVTAPLFQAVFRMENLPDQVKFDLSGLTITPVPVPNNTTEYDLIFSTTTDRDYLIANAIYSADLFKAGTINQLLTDFEELLEAILAEPEKSIADLSGRFERSDSLPQAERQKVLVEWNNTRSPIATDVCFHEIFEAQVKQTPDQIAAIFETEEVTYRELNARANQLARYLQMLGVGPDVRVAICVERSVRMLVGLLGILKAGGAYLPLDPSYPLDRLSFMLDDGQAPILLTESKLLDTLPVGAAQVICLDDEWEVIAAESDENVVSGVDPRNLAYVIYTSGSTGKPKGVMIEHSGLINLAEAQVKTFGEPPGGRVLQLASLSFDASIFEIVMALRAGATICLGTRETLLPGQPLLELLRDRKITNLTIPPSILASLPSDELPELKTIIVAGEACTAENVARWSRGRKFFNAYGPTETTVWASTALCEDGTQKPTIGRPILNAKIFLLNQQLVPVAIGSPGELYIGGAGVARGYLNRPELTAERFVPDPFSGDEGTRLYRTGDLARYLEDGRIEFLGRIDHQVKLRGLRIELGEIESILTEHPQLTMCAVVLQDRDTADARLVAYIVPREDAPSNSELRDYLKDKLPEYMIPSVFVTLAELPLTPNGKVDHRSLPSVTAAEFEPETVFVAPRTRTEEILAGSWLPFLNVERVGIDDNFFALGGDSIRSVQVLSKAKERGVEVTLQQLFKYQTIRKLAEHLSTSPNVSEVAPRTEPFAMVSEADRRKMPDAVEDAYPLTSMQAGMVFQSDLQKDAALYHAVNSLHLKIPFNQRALQTALQQLAELNTVMRTSFDLVSFSEPLQLVHRDVQIPIEVEDLRSLPEEEQKDRINEWIQVDKYRRLDLNTAPLLRFHIHRRTDESVQFTFTAHHSIFDGWSDAVFLTELLELYLAIVNEEAVAAAQPLPVSFRDYVVLERQASSSKESQSFWSDWLSDFDLAKPSRLVPAPEEDAPRFDSTQIRFETELSEKLNQLARSAAVPLKTVLLAAHLHVMSALDGQSDVLTGLVSNGRPDTTGGERIIGLFLNTLPFRAQLNGGTWEDLIGATFAAELETLPHRRYPLAQIQLDAGGQTLFDTCFNYTHFHVYNALADVNELEVLGGGGVAETEFAVMANFNVDLSHDYIELLLICDSFQLPITQIKNLREYYIATLSAMVADPLARYEAHSPLTQAEKDRLLTEWNQTAVDYPRDKTISELFDAQVQRTPNTVAVVFDNEELTYTDLNVRANQLAHYLHTIGVKADSRVGICLERSPEMVVAVLGVLKAGAAYVPLDPNYPADRLMLILEQSNVEVLLTHTSLASRFPALELSTVYLDQAREQTAQQRGNTPEQLSGPDNLAYVIYTSGSTGTPKGVAMTQRPLVNLVSWEVRRIGVPLRSSQFASLSFDVSFQEIFSTLCGGGTLVLIPEEKRRDAKQLLELIIDQQIERLCVPFVALNYLATAAEAEGKWPTQLRQVMSAGEQLKITRPVRRLFQNLPGCTLDNQCGPSETHAVVGFLLPDSVRDWTALPPIGRPLSNVRLYVLDKHMRPVPAGVPGTLYIAGDCISRGYLDRPDLTADRYVPNPFSDRGERLYRSGDIVRYLPSGDVEWLRREDDQVKIRGFRVELGEVETALTNHTSVREALVIVREDVPGERNLVAYVVPESTVSPDALRQYLQQRLPDYMVPSAFVLMASLPLTPSGKLNRRALPAPETADSASEISASQAPRTALEELIGSIWADTLRMREVDVTKSFFDMGGHSLSAIQLISRVREALQVEVELQKLFDRPTVRAMAEEVERMLRLGAGVQSGPIQKRDRQDIAPLSFAQQRLWFIEQLEATGSSLNVPVTLRLTGDLNVAALEKTMNEIVRRHEVLRTTFRLEEGEPVQVIHPASLTKLEVEDLTGVPESEREAEAQRLVKEEGRRPFDLSRGPLLRVRLLKINDNDHIFLSTMHHIVSDGWSMSLLIREMAALYEAFTTGALSPLPEPEIQYADFAIWQREHLQGETLENQLSYWRKQLAGAPAVLEIPTDYPRPAVQTYHGAVHTHVVPESTLESLKRISRENGVTLFMTVLAAWQTLLSKYSGQQDIVVGSPIANRNRAETESTIGFFVNTLVLRTDLSGNPTFRELLSRVREVTLGAYAHEDMPFEKLVEEIQPERSLSQAPLFQVLFTFQNTSQETLDMPRVKVSSSELDHDTAKYDLLLGAIEINNKLNCTIEYRTDLFEAQTIERLLQHLQVLLASVAGNPEQRLSEIELLSRSERQQLLED